MHTALSLIAALSLSSAVIAQTRDAPTLVVGSKAPTLSDVDWLTPDKTHNEWTEGEVYVLDFWATWCGPCISAMPHVIELQEQYEDQGVHVIGVAIWPQSKAAKTSDWIKDPKKYTSSWPSGLDINYSIAEDQDGKTAKSFMAAAKKNGIPTVMIVGKTGNIEWIGHPMNGMDEVLELIVDDSFDHDAWLTERKIKEERSRELTTKLSTAFEKEDWPTVFSSVDALVELDPKRFGVYLMEKYQIAVSRAADEKIVEQTKSQILNGPLSDDAQFLGLGAYRIVSEESTFNDDEKDLDFALKLAELAIEKSKRSDPFLLSVLARTHFLRGEHQDAVRHQEQAVRLSEGQQTNKPYKATLDKYRAAAAKG